MLLSACWNHKIQDICTYFAWFTDTVTSGDNLIVAGNLDLEVSYKNQQKDTDWTDLQGSQTVFSQGLWEPGHTEYVTLKIHNAGTLALKYQINVSPISESGGINVFGASFKLSDYLVFKATDASDTDTTPADRAAARTLAGTETKLNQSSLSKTTKLLAGGSDQYVTLVIYMPENVGNEANYKTGTTAPQIKLGITVLATQVEEENDSFDNTYDTNAYTELDKTVSYNYFPQVNVTGQVKVSGSDAVSAGETAGNEITVASNVVTVYSDAEEDHSNTIASVSVPVKPTSDAVAGEIGNVKLKVTKMDNTYSGINITDDQESTSYDVETIIEGKIEKAENGLYTVNINIGAGKSDLTVTHVHGSTTTPMTKVSSAADVDADNEYYYDIDTGVLKMVVSEFSEFATVYNKPVCAIGTTAYGSLAEAFNAAKTGDTITLMKDCATGIEYTMNNPLVLASENVTLNLNGKTITTTNNFTFVIAGNNDVVMNGTIKSRERRDKDGNTATEDGPLYRGYPLVVAATASDGSVANVKVNEVTIYGGISAGGSIKNNATSIKGAGNVTLTDCTIQDGAAYALYSQLGSTINVVSGTYNAGHSGLAYLDTAQNPTNNTISITGGTFSSDPSAYVAKGYKAVESDDVWTVSLSVN